MIPLNPHHPEPPCQRRADDVWLASDRDRPARRAVPGQADALPSDPWSSLRPPDGAALTIEMTRGRHAQHLLVERAAVKQDVTRVEAPATGFFVGVDRLARDILPCAARILGSSERRSIGGRRHDQ